MVLCVVFGCSKRSGRDKDVRFFRIPKILTKGSSNLKELSKKRRAGFIAAISREDITEKILVNDRICSRHFISGQPAALKDNTNPDWLPTLNLGHIKLSDRRIMAGTERWRRRKAREDAQQHRNEVLSESTSREQVASESTQWEASESTALLTSETTSDVQQETDNIVPSNTTNETGVQTLCEAETTSIQTDLSSKMVSHSIVGHSCLSVLYNIILF